MRWLYQAASEPLLVEEPEVYDPSADPSWAACAERPPALRKPGWPNPSRLDRLVNLQTEEVVAEPVDKWWSPLSVPVRLQAWLPLSAGQMDPVPLPDPEWLPPAIPWYVPLSQPVRPLVPQQPRMDSLMILQTEEVVAEYIDKWDSMTVRLLPVHPREPITRWPFRQIVEDLQPEDITLDKWYVPFTQNFRTLPPAPLPKMDVLLRGLEVETITLDKWYATTTALPPYLWWALRGPQGPEAQAIDLTVTTAPWQKFQEGPILPIEDIPGVTLEYWEGYRVLPQIVLVYLRLYQPLQTFPLDALVRECNRPRRRVDERRGRCGTTA